MTTQANDNVLKYALVGDNKQNSAVRVVSVWIGPGEKLAETVYGSALNEHKPRGWRTTHTGSTIVRKLRTCSDIDDVELRPQLLDIYVFSNKDIRKVIRYLKKGIQEAGYAAIRV